jgi:2-polyprenyl-3-methyl-5-hydroxy-6-metoxy-1,4-benzoquinol methylase
MPWPFALSQRRREPEVMDQPDLDPHQHRRALRGLQRINALSGSASILWPALRGLARQTAAPLRVLDIATGAGDVPLRLWKRSRRAGLEIQFAGCDQSPTALEYARGQAERHRADIPFFAWEVVNGPLPGGYDVLTCSLFLHHLEEEKVVDLLRRLREAARRMVLINDLRRGTDGLLLAYLGTRVLSGSPVVHTDGPLSVRAAFTLPEVRDLARRAGLDGATVARHWPCRFLLSWNAHV